MPVYTRKWAEFGKHLRFSIKILRIYLPDNLHFFPNKDIIDLICGGLPKRADAIMDESWSFCACGAFMAAFAVNLKGCYLCQFGKQWYLESYREQRNFFQ